MRQTINRLHNRVSGITELLIFESDLKGLRDQKTINHRQYAIVNELARHGQPMSINELRNRAWYQALYINLTDKTRQPDLLRLSELQLVRRNEANQLHTGFMPQG